MYTWTFIFYWSFVEIQEYFRFVSSEAHSAGERITSPGSKWSRSSRKDFLKCSVHSRKQPRVLSFRPTNIHRMSRVLSSYQFSSRGARGELEIQVLSPSDSAPKRAYNFSNEQPEYNGGDISSQYRFSAHVPYPMVQDCTLEVERRRFRCNQILLLQKSGRKNQRAARKKITPVKQNVSGEPCVRACMHNRPSILAFCFSKMYPDQSKNRKNRY